MGQGTVPCPILSMCRNVDFIQGAGKIIPRALVVGFNWAFHRGTENRPLSHKGRAADAYRELVKEVTGFGEKQRSKSADLGR